MLTYNKIDSHPVMYLQLKDLMLLAAVRKDISENFKFIIDTLTENYKRGNLEYGLETFYTINNEEIINYILQVMKEKPTVLLNYNEYKYIEPKVLEELINKKEKLINKVTNNTVKLILKYRKKELESLYDYKVGNLEIAFPLEYYTLGNYSSYTNPENIYKIFESYDIHQFFVERVDGKSLTDDECLDIQVAVADYISFIVLNKPLKGEFVVLYSEDSCAASVIIPKENFYNIDNQRQV